ncbi:2-C-methyl-D-erythritol 4-phosphate cytidylyltransferase [uncultured Mycolicibacterium sp.]|uniref:IspD/TarI family cytidylyltransferase n=1 Tax=uncultured Mycolicibacterium sp. TaxID=2320817 RepID=UPI00262F19F4|nr:IspD/TarI family cytidylyltransferase [uncultured Mycolicibacterium sp.]
MTAAVGVVLAAGMGTRVGADGNKAYLQLAGRSMVSWSLATMLATPAVGRTVLVYRQGERALAEDTVRRELPGARVEFVEGGASRHRSEHNVLNYLAADIVAGAVDVVAIHDAARPLADPAMVRTAVELAREYGGAVPAVPATDVVRVDDDGTPRPADGPIVRVQTPQAFRADPLLQAYHAADRERFEGTDTASCVERYTTLTVRTFPGAERNLKVTYAHDVAVAEHLLRAGRGAGV